MTANRCEPHFIAGGGGRQFKLAARDAQRLGEVGTMLQETRCDAPLAQAG